VSVRDVTVTAVTLMHLLWLVLDSHLPLPLCLKGQPSGKWKYYLGAAAWGGGESRPSELPQWSLGSQTLRSFPVEVALETAMAI
jgi:hypothetical protein